MLHFFRFHFVHHQVKQDNNNNELEQVNDVEATIQQFYNNHAKEKRTNKLIDYYFELTLTTS